MASDMAWPSEREGGGFRQPPPDKGGKLMDEDVERVTGPKRPAPVGVLLSAATHWK